SFKEFGEDRSKRCEADTDDDLVDAASLEEDPIATSLEEDPTIASLEENPAAAL
ncbi:hypothetical protein BGZ99_009387, partial [Dissophora globulifera]